MAARWAPLYRTAYLLTGRPRTTPRTCSRRRWRGPASAGLDPRQAGGRCLRAAGDGPPDVAPVEEARSRGGDRPPARCGHLGGLDVRADHLALWAEIRKLPPRMRATLVLRYVEDLTGLNRRRARLLHRRREEPDPPRPAAAASRPSRSAPHGGSWHDHQRDHRGPDRDQGTPSRCRRRPARLPGLWCARSAGVGVTGRVLLGRRGRGRRRHRRDRGQRRRSATRRALRSRTCPARQVDLGAPDRLLHPRQPADGPRPPGRRARPRAVQRGGHRLDRGPGLRPRRRQPHHRPPGGASVRRGARCPDARPGAERGALGRRPLPGLARPRRHGASLRLRGRSDRPFIRGNEEQLHRRSVRGRGAGGEPQRGQPPRRSRRSGGPRPRRPRRVGVRRRR